MIYDHYINMYNWTFNGKSQEFISRVKNWFADQRAWLNSNINKNHLTDQVLWKYVELLNAQYLGSLAIKLYNYQPHILIVLVALLLCSSSGLYEGYNDHAEANQKLDWFSFDILNGNGDMLDLLNALDGDRLDFAAMSIEEIKSWVSSN